MLSSTSSSDLRGTPWGRVLGTAALFALGIVVAGEVGLRVKGFHPTVQDDALAWSRLRERATEPGALVLIGASRMQLDVDLDVLRQATGRQPLQLAIDGASFLPVLRDLADDEAFNGTALVDFSDQAAFEASADAGALALIQAHAQDRFSRAPSAWTERRLGSLLRRPLAAFADGATPLASWRHRLLGPRQERQYLETRADRSRLADYRLVSMPRFRYERALRHIGRPDLANPDATAAQLDGAIADAIAKTPAATMDGVATQRLAAIVDAVSRIQARGGRVILLRLPTDGVVRAYDEKRWPAATFERAIRARAGAAFLDTGDDAAFAAFACPDGSHLDRRDRAAFTRLLATRLGPIAGRARQTAAAIAPPGRGSQ